MIWCTDRSIKTKVPGFFTVFFFLFFLLLVLTKPALLSAEEIFTISNSYQNLLSNSDETGILDRVFKEAFRRIGVDMEIVFTSTERSLPDVNAGILDAEANRIKGMEALYPNLRRVPEPNMVMEFVAFSKKDFPIDGWDSIRDLDIGLVRGWKILEENTKDFQNVVKVPTEYELFNMLEKDRIDIALYAKLTGYATFKEMGLRDIHHLEPPLESRDMYLYVYKSHSELTDKIAAALREIKEDGTYQRILHEVGEEYGVDLD